MVNIDFSREQAAELAHDYQAAVIAGERKKATDMIDEALEQGLTIRRLYLEVLQAVQYRIGELWQANKISVAVEHYSTAVSQLVMSGLFPQIVGDGSAGRTMVGCCVSGELHEMGLRMVCDFFEMENWSTHFLGSGMPEEDVVSFVRSRGAHLICISCTTTYNIHRVKRLVDALRSGFGEKCPAIMVGGGPFIAAPQLVSQVRADATALDAAGAVKIAWEMVG